MFEILTQGKFVCDQIVERVAQRQGSAQTLGDAMQCPADHLLVSVGVQPVVLDHMRCDALQSGRELSVVIAKQSINVRGKIRQ